MANPLKELPLSQQAFQRIQETPIDAPPAKVWATLINPNNWFFFEDRGSSPKHTLDLRPGGMWTTEGKDGMASLMGTVTHIEPGKLLRFTGQMGLTHLPCLNVFIYELQPAKDGKATVLRVGQRTFGFIDPDVSKRYEGGWNQLMGNLKKAAESAG